MEEVTLHIAELPDIPPRILYEILRLRVEVFVVEQEAAYPDLEPGSSIIVSALTYEGAKDAIEARYLGRARVVGKETPVPVYEPLAEKGKLTPAWAKALPVWERGIKAFYDKKYEEALAGFTDFLGLMPKDGPGELYLNISRDYAALPPDDWDQVFNLTAK